MKICSALGAALVSVPLFCVVAWGMEVTESSPISFGVIELHPSGADIVVDAREQAATPRCQGQSLVFDGGSGLLTIRNSVGGSSQQVWLEYPEKVSLTRKGSKTKVELVELARWSRFGEQPFQVTAGEEVQVYLGGRLIAPGDLDEGSYSGTVNLNLCFE